jgi:hypothetical protein
MVPLAPGLLSTITLVPSFAPTRTASTRASASAEPPGAYGTTSVMGRSGKAACADAAAARRQAPSMRRMVL